MNTKKSVEIFTNLGILLKANTGAFYDDDSSAFRDTLLNARKINPWFTIENQLAALQALGTMLEKEKLTKWLSNYHSGSSQEASEKIGIIMAGNIPAVGFHDLLCVLVSGNDAVIKLASDDSVIMKWLIKEIISIEPSMEKRMSFTEKLTGIDAIIATGSDNTSRYFEYYFSKYPHVIRKNRNAVAVLSGIESESDIKNLGKDIFSFFGMGCRNVSKLYVPRNYDFNFLFRNIESYSPIMEHNKYMNNYDYYHAVLLMNSEKFLTNNFMILKEDTNIHSPVSVLNYEFYDGQEEIKAKIQLEKKKIQCVVGNMSFLENPIPFGKAQQPELWDYADGVNTLDFLASIA